jgi:hypothetical protein
VKADVKTRWVQALRSGEYPQTRGALRRVSAIADGPPRGFCCLGVLCDLAAKEGVTTPVEQGGLIGYRTVGRYNKPFTETSILPSEVRDWAGLDSPYGLEWDNGLETLTSVNDGGGSFAEIADRIEAAL